jgi:hypothetical protein
MKHALFLSFLVVQLLSGAAFAGGPTRAPIASVKPAVAGARAGGLQRLADKIASGTGSAIGFGAGVGVTAGIVLFKSERKPLLGEDGQRLTIKSGDITFGLQERHVPTVGPKITGFAEKLKKKVKGPLSEVAHAFVAGMGEGATKAPMAEARMEAGLLRAVRWLTGAPADANRIDTSTTR